MGATVPDLLDEVARYYSAKLAEHGETARGVDWNGEESQFLRFIQLARIIDKTEDFTINDLGCGYGALYDFLKARFSSFNYLGCDISQQMIEAATNRLAGEAVCFHVGAEPAEPADFGIASGIFNVRLDWPKEDWQPYMESTLDIMDRTSRRGFAFNCLTSYSDIDRMRPQLFYADPGAMFDLCKRRYSRHVALIHDYGLYEFTILVRKHL